MNLGRGIPLLALGLAACADMPFDHMLARDAAKRADGLLTAAEIEQVRAAVRPCWADVVNRDEIRLRVVIDAEAHVRLVQVLDRVRYENDSHYHAISDAAAGALLNPGCSTLPLAPDRVTALMPSFILTLKARP